MVMSLSLKFDDQVMDIPNKISKRGLIYFPDFCQLVLEKFRGDAVEEEIFRQNMFKVLINDDWVKMNKYMNLNPTEHTEGIPAWWSSNPSIHWLSSTVFPCSFLPPVPHQKHDSHHIMKQKSLNTWGPQAKGMRLIKFKLN